MGKKFNVAVIGAGDMGKRHVIGWKAAGHEVVSVTDINTEAARKLADQNGVAKVYADYKEAITSDEVDIVSVCLPLALHAPVSIFAANQEKHVFCEKPLTRSLEEAEAIDQAIKANGVKFGIGFQVNFAAGIQQLASWAKEEKFGKPMVINNDSVAQVRPKRVMHDRNGNNGPVMDVCCHSFMNWRTIFQSKPKSVYARGMIIAKDRPELSHIKELAIDTAVITVEYESGDIGTMTVCWGGPEKLKMRGRPFRIFGPKGGAEGNPSGKMMVYVGDQAEENEYPAEDLHEKQFRAFAESIEQGKQVPAGLDVAKEILILTLAAFESIETNRAVAVQFD